MDKIENGLLVRLTGIVDTVHAEHGKQSWPVRIRDLSGGLLGAGVLLGDRHVLTCAHVLADGASGDGPGPEGKVDVDLVGQPGRPPVSARVVPGCWVPPADDGGGDLALLALDSPAEPSSVRLTALSLAWQRPVYTFGFPAGLSDGVHVRAVLAGQAGPDRQWIQMNARDPHFAIRAGFSGSGVVDESTGAVLGIVVGAWSDARAGLAWMIPAETIGGHLPRVREWMAGASSADPRFLRPPRVPSDLDAAHAVAGFFAGDRPGNVMILVTGPPKAPVAVAVNDAVRLAHRSVSAGGGHTGTAPPVGSIDLAVDAAAHTPDDVARRIVTFAGPARPGPADREVIAAVAPRTLVITGIDESTDPGRLVDDVIGPIVGRAYERDMRLLLGFREPAVGLRLGLLGRRIDVLHDIEEAAHASHRDATGVLADPPPGKSYSADLRLRLTALRAAARRRGDDCADQVASHERMVDRALRAAGAVRAGLNAGLARHRELTGRLTSERALAARDGLAEDLVLGRLYRDANDLLTGGRCDLAEASRAVERFVEERRARTGSR